MVRRTTSCLRYGSYANAAVVQSFAMDAAGNRVSSVDAAIQTFAYDPHTDVLRTALRSAGFYWDTVSYGYGSKGEQISEIHTTPFRRLTGGV